MRRKCLTLAVATGLAMVWACGGISGLIEQANFALDNCNPTDETTEPNCQTAVNTAEEVLTGDSTNVPAALAASSGYLGLGHLDFLTLVADLADLQNSDTEDFEQFRDFISGPDGYETTEGVAIDIGGTSDQPDSIQSAKDAFAGLMAASTTTLDVPSENLDADGAATDDNIKRAAFQLGAIQAIDAFVRPVKLSGDAVGDITANIDADVATAVENDFLSADNNMILGGATEEESGDLLSAVRENYCRCSRQEPLGGIAGFTPECLRDLMRCELYVDPEDRIVGSDIGIEQDYNQDGGSNNLDCVVLITPTTGSATCADGNTAP